MLGGPQGTAAQFGGPLSLSLGGGGQLDWGEQARPSPVGLIPCWGQAAYFGSRSGQPVASQAGLPWEGAGSMVVVVRTPGGPCRAGSVGTGSPVSGWLWGQGCPWMAWLVLGV